MNRVFLWMAAIMLALPAVAAAQEAKQANLENTLWGCGSTVALRRALSEAVCGMREIPSQYWVTDFRGAVGGTLRNKEEMVATQAAANPVTGVRPFPADFKLVAVYGDVALGTDHTDFKTAPA